MKIGSNGYLYVAIILGLSVSFILHAFTSSFLAETFNVATPNYRENKKTPFIKITQPIITKELSNPLTVSGKASGVWFFEGVMQVEIWDDGGAMLGHGPVTAQGDSMTEKIVSFEGVIPFDNTLEKSGVLIFKQEDVSGEGRDVALYKYPIFFKQQVTTGSCSAHDCGSQVCSPEEGGACLWSPESECYSHAVCERQQNGMCGFTKTEAFKLCMSQL